MMSINTDENSTWAEARPWYPRPGYVRVVHIMNEVPWYKSMLNSKRKKR